MMTAGMAMIIERDISSAAMAVHSMLRIVAVFVLAGEEVLHPAGWACGMVATDTGLVADRVHSIDWRTLRRVFS